MEKHDKEAALVGFWVDDKPAQWRFSLLKRDLKIDTSGERLKVRTIFSPVRRFSYLVGSGERTHTAQQQLLSLLTRDDKMELDIQALEEAFDVEPISKEFFDSYRQLFEETNRALQAFLQSHPDHNAHFEHCQIDPIEFAKRVLAQIVFLYFLQRKGWLGVARDQGWGSGDRHFLRTRYNVREKGESYFRSFLQPLFYEALAYKLERNFYDRWGVRIPFLNGGLFEPWRDYDWQSQPVDLPDILFSNASGSGILDIFDRYNFTVQEDDPVEREVAVDPEILGKVFENLIEENRRHASGTYYTPRFVVHYMCQEVLIDYLAERHPQIKRDDLSFFVIHGQELVEKHRYVGEVDAHDDTQHTGLPRIVIDSATVLDVSLKTVTICDPAVGSGAFPLGMLNVIVNARMVLDEYLGQELTEFKAKFHAINHSLYGVDLDGGAVEIAKLRLWLSLVVDEERSAQIQPLPNLDYKMMQGNSLVSHLNFKPLIDKRLLTRQLVTQSTADDLRRRLSALQREALEIQHSSDVITSENRRRIKELRHQIMKLDNKIADIEATLERTDDEFDLLTELDVAARTRREFLVLQQQFFECTDTDDKRHLRLQIDEAHDVLVKLSIGQHGNQTESEIENALEAFDQEKRQCEKSYFLWQLNFNSVFAPVENNDEGNTHSGGFDIVIGNPPYVKGNSIDKDIKEAIKFEMPRVFFGSADLYTYFYFIGLSILRPGGHLTYITSNTFMRSNFGRQLRSMIASTTKIAEIVDVSKANVFSAIAYPAICRVQNQPPDRSTEFRYGQVSKNAMLSDITTALADHSFRQLQSTIGADRWLLAPQPVQKLMSKLLRSGKTVGEHIDYKIHRGISTGLNRAFVIDSETRNGLVAEDSKSKNVIKRWIEGSDIKPWNVNWNGKWVIVFASSQNADWPWSRLENENDAERLFAANYPAVYRHLLSFRTAARMRGDKGKFWWELRSCRYYDAFERQKIVWGNLGARPGFASDGDGNYVCAPAVCIESDDIGLLAVLNSSVCDWFMRLTAAQRANGFLEYKPMYVNDMPMPDQGIAGRLIGERDVSELTRKVKELYDGEHPAKEDRYELLQRDVNRIVYDMFALNKSEIEIIERAVGLHRKDGENEMSSTEEELPIPRAATFGVIITFPNLDFSRHDFSKLAMDFSEFFRRYARTTPAVWSKTDEFLAGDNYWSIESAHIMYEESSWEVAVVILVVATRELLNGVGTLLNGYGNYLKGRAAMIEAVDARYENHAKRSSVEAASDVADKYRPDPTTSAGNDDRTDEFDFREPKIVDGRFFDTIEEAEASLIQPEQVESAPQSNRSNELHILIRGDIKERFTIDVHPKKEN